MFKTKRRKKNNKDKKKILVLKVDGHKMKENLSKRRM